MEVYSTDYKYRMLEALQSHFETIWMVLGDHEFEKIVFSYIQANPSQNYDLNQYGTDFPQFLKEQKNLLEEIPFLIDLAEFELAFWRIFHSQNPIELAVEDFTQEKILNSFFEFDQHTEILQLNFNVFPLFESRTKTLRDFLDQNDRELIMNKANFILYKKNSKTICNKLSDAEFNFFNKLKTKKTLIDVINLTEDATQEEVTNIFKLIASELLRNLKET
jgi:hypothetical protein